MRLAGKVERAIDNKKFLIRIEGEEIPQIGDVILSPDLRPMGKVVDILGNVKSPLALGITLREDVDAIKLIGKKVHFSGSLQKRPARRKK